MIQRSDFPTREAFLAAVEPPKPTVKQVRAKRAIDSARQFPCIHRGLALGETPCHSCGNHFAQVHACNLHQACVIEGRPRDERVKTCSTCMDRSTGRTEIPFESFMNKYAGKSGIVVGRGHTTYEWNRLADHDGPIFAINDAMNHVERYVDCEHVFGHAQDERIVRCLPTGAALVICRGSNFGKAVRDRVLNGRVIWAIQPARGDESVLKRDREFLRMDRRLFHASKRGGSSPSPTICQALHFAWYVGCEHVMLVGCHGAATGYNPQMENRSESPEVRVEKYAAARADAEFVMSRLGMTWEFAG